MLTKIVHRTVVRVIAWGLLRGPAHWWTPAGQILGGPDPCDPYGVDAYAVAGPSTWQSPWPTTER